MRDAKGNQRVRWFLEEALGVFTKNLTKKAVSGRFRTLPNSLIAGSGKLLRVEVKNPSKRLKDRFGIVIYSE